VTDQAIKTGPASTPAQISLARRVLERDVLTSAAMGFVGGFIDAAGFIALAGLFTSHVTGNFVLIGAELISTSPGVIAKLLALPVFMIAVAAARLLALAFERRGWAALRLLLLIEAGFIGVFLVAGLLLTPLGSADSLRSITVGMFGVAAMGVQNAIGRLALAHLSATTVMTVNVTQTVIDAVDLWRGEQGKAREAAVGRLWRMVPTIGAFAVGALLGAFGLHWWSFWCLLIPIAVLLAVVVGVTVWDRQTAAS
jgi:uncharacterized membrane protein YoaK (UPF0700 family)